MGTDNGEITAEARIRQLRTEGEGSRHPKVKDLLLGEAFNLFYSQGIRSTGIDLLIERAGIAKASFYRHFPSKEDLILAYIDQRHDAWMAWLAEKVSRQAGEPRQQLLALFDCLGELFSDSEYRGCAVNNAVAESGSRSESLLTSARAKKMELHAYIEALASRAGLSHPSAVADAWSLLIDGAMVKAQREPGLCPAIQAKMAAALLLEHWDAPMAGGAPTDGGPADGLRLPAP